MTTTYSPFKGKAKADGGDYKTEVPSAETHDARVVALVDLGTHSESYKGEEAKDRHSVLVVYELDEEVEGFKGRNHVVGVRYTLSFHEKSTLRKIVESITNDGQKFTDNADVDLTKLLGQPCTVQISHTTKTTDKGERVYANVGVISAVARKKHQGFFQATRKPFLWSIGDDPAALPDWLPRVYGEKVADLIHRSKEAAASRVVRPDDGAGPDGPRQPEDDTPF